MDKMRIDGAAKQVSGKLKVAAGRLVGDPKLVADGTAEQAAGKILNVKGGLKDAVKDAIKD